LVFQNREGFVADGVEVGTDDERGFCKCPESEVGLFFGLSKDAQSDLEHVWVVPPVIFAGFICRHLVLKEIGDELLPLVGGRVINIDILGSSPRVGHGISPISDLFVTPIANGVEDVTASSHQSGAHGSVSFGGGNSFVKAVVVLKVVNTPFGVDLSILSLIPKTTWESKTGFGSGR